MTSAKRTAHSYAFPVDVSPERVFPLLCPVREYDWIDGWQCQLVHSASGVVEEGCIFVTDNPPEGKTIWTAVVHDPAEHRVEFLRVTPESHVSRMALSVTGAGSGSILEIGYTFTAIDVRGEALVALLEDGRALAARSERLVRSLDHYLRTGALLKPFGGAAAG